MIQSEIPDFREMTGYREVKQVVVVGCGGTGGYVVGPLARMIRVYNERNRQSYSRLPGVALILSDGDVVEEKNLQRQHFIRTDLGRNKAEVMAARYASALGMEIQTLPEYIESKDAFASMPRTGNATVVIGCVDNNASRRVIHEWFVAGGPDKFWIDSGNEEESGQVICGFRPQRYAGFGQRPFSLPSVVEIYPELLEGDAKFNSELSCAELAESAPQNMMANVTAATLVLNFVQKILYRKPLASHGVSFGIDNAFRTRLNTPEALNKVDPKRRRSWDPAPELPEPEPKPKPKAKRKPKVEKESAQ